MNSEKKPLIARILWVFVIVLGTGILFQLVLSSYSLWRKSDIVHEREAYLDQLEQKQVELKKGLSDSLRPEFIEKEARNKLGLAKEGETLVMLPESSNGAEFSTKQTQTVQEDPKWKLWWKLFF